MNKVRFFHNTNRIAGQHALRALMLLAALFCSCHRMPSPLDEDPRLPASYRSPQMTFQTWTRATVSGDEQNIRDCYWSGLKPEELGAWMRENLREQARQMFQSARLIEVVPATLVEVNFTFAFGEDSEEIRGVMVRTKEGWKIQSW